MLLPKCRRVPEILPLASSLLLIGVGLCLNSCPEAKLNKLNDL